MYSAHLQWNLLLENEDFFSFWQNHFGEAIKSTLEVWGTGRPRFCKVLPKGNLTVRGSRREEDAETAETKRGAVPPCVSEAKPRGKG